MGSADELNQQSLHPWTLEDYKMSDSLHPIVDIAIELLTSKDDGSVTLEASDRNTLVEVLNDVPQDHLPKTIFALIEFAEMVKSNHQSPEAGDRLIQVAELYINRLESVSESGEARQREALARGNKFLAFSEQSRPSLMSSQAQSVLNVRDCVQQWRGVIRM